MSTRVTSYTTIASPLGDLVLAAADDALTGLYIAHPPKSLDTSSWRRDAEPLRDAIAQVRAYFAGELRDFDLPLAPAGTPFQRQVWEALRTIPYGETRSYGYIAAAIGRPSASRAVGMANGRNPISIIVPCHRVIGSNGLLTGYGGGLDRKQILLDLERRAVAPERENQLSLL